MQQYTITGGFTRESYHPLETIRCVMYVRTQAGENASGILLLAALYAPNGTMVDERPVHVVLGEAIYMYRLPLSAPRGVWKLEVRAGSQLLAVYYFRVEIPPLILVPPELPYEIPLGSRLPLAFKIANTVDESITATITVTASNNKSAYTAQATITLPPRSITAIDSPDIQLTTSNWSTGSYEVHVKVSAGNITLSSTHRILIVRSSIYTSIQLRSGASSSQLLVKASNQLASPIDIEVAWSMPEAAVSGSKSFTVPPSTEVSEAIPLETSALAPGSYAVKVVVWANGKYTNMTWVRIHVLRKLSIEVSLQPARKLAKVRVYDSMTKAPIKGAEVTVRYPNGTVTTCYTDTRGIVYIATSAAGMHNLTVSKSGYMPSTTVFSVVLPSSTVSPKPPSPTTPKLTPQMEQEKTSPLSSPSHTATPEGEEEGIGAAAAVAALAIALAAIITYLTRHRKRKVIEEVFKEIPEV